MDKGCNMFGYRDDSMELTSVNDMLQFEDEVLTGMTKSGQETAFKTAVMPKGVNYEIDISYFVYNNDNVL